MPNKILDAKTGEIIGVTPDGAFLDEFYDGDTLVWRRVATADAGGMSVLAEWGSEPDVTPAPAAGTVIVGHPEVLEATADGIAAARAHVGV